MLTIEHHTTTGQYTALLWGMPVAQADSLPTLQTTMDHLIGSLIGWRKAPILEVGPVGDDEPHSETGESDGYLESGSTDTPEHAPYAPMCPA